MRLPRHPAGYTRPTAPADRQALAATAERNGWPDLVIYGDGDQCGGAQGPGLDVLEAAVQAGRHDALLLPLPGLLGSGARLTRLLAACTRHGVPVHFVPSGPLEAERSSAQAPGLPGLL